MLCHGGSIIQNSFAIYKSHDKTENFLSLRNAAIPTLYTLNKYKSGRWQLTIAFQNILSCKQG